MQEVHFSENADPDSKRYTPRGIIVQRVSVDMFASLVTPCRHHYGIGENGPFTCLHPDDNHAHIVIADDGMSILPACIESKEFLLDVLNTLVEENHLTRDEKAQFVLNEAKRLTVEHLTTAEMQTKKSVREFEFATTPIYIVLDPAE